MITATLRSYDTLSAVSGDVMVGLLSPSCTPPWQSDTLMCARFAPSEESNTSLKGVKENAKLRVAQQTRNEAAEEDGEFVLTLWPKSIFAKQNNQYCLFHNSFLSPVGIRSEQCYRCCTNITRAISKEFISTQKSYLTKKKTLSYQTAYTETSWLLQRIQIQPELSKKNRIPLQKFISVTLSNTGGGKSRVKQSHVSNDECSPGKVRCITIKLLSRSVHLLSLKDSILRDKIEDRPVNVKVPYDYTNLALLFVKASQENHSSNTLPQLLHSLKPLLGMRPTPKPQGLQVKHTVGFAGLVQSPSCRFAAHLF